MFHPDWFNSTHSWIYCCAGPTLPFPSYSSLLSYVSTSVAASPFCIPAMPLKVRRAECIDSLIFYRACALSWELKRWRKKRRDRERVDMTIFLAWTIWGKLTFCSFKIVCTEIHSQLGYVHIAALMLKTIFLCWLCRFMFVRDMQLSHMHKCRCKASHVCARIAALTVKSCSFLTPLSYTVFNPIRVGQ